MDVQKWHSGNDYRVATLSKSYLATKEIGPTLIIGKLCFKKMIVNVRKNGRPNFIEIIVLDVPMKTYNWRKRIKKTVEWLEKVKNYTLRLVFITKQGWHIFK